MWTTFSVIYFHSWSIRWNHNIYDYTFVHCQCNILCDCVLLCWWGTGRTQKGGGQVLCRLPAQRQMWNSHVSSIRALWVKLRFLKYFHSKLAGMFFSLVESEMKTVRIINSTGSSCFIWTWEVMHWQLLFGVLHGQGQWRQGRKQNCATQFFFSLQNTWDKWTKEAFDFNGN